MKRLCTICARGGSKGVKNKNLRELQGKPLLAHSIRQAKKSGLFEFIAVSSDSEEILKVAREWGADETIVRPPALSTDTAAKVPAIQHCVREVERLRNTRFDVTVDLDATSPLRDASDIAGAVKLLEEKNVSNVITGCLSRRSPYFNMVELNAAGFVQLSKRPEKPIVRRQDSPKAYDLNASIYVWKRDALFDGDSVFKADTLLYVMPEERSLDIDDEHDLEMMEFLVRNRELS